MTSALHTPSGNIVTYTPEPSAFRLPFNLQWQGVVLLGLLFASAVVMFGGLALFAWVVL
jgi:hypothetical protein